MFDFATMIAPAAESFSTAVAAYGLTYPSRILDAHDVGMTDVAMLSLMTTGTPSNDGAVALPTSESHSAARDRA
jgi:hypothetical protein